MSLPSILQTHAHTQNSEDLHIFYSFNFIFQSFLREQKLTYGSNPEMCTVILCPIDLPTQNNLWKDKRIFSAYKLKPSLFPEFIFVLFVLILILIKAFKYARLQSFEWEQC